MKQTPPRSTKFIVISEAERVKSARTANPNHKLSRAWSNRMKRHGFLTEGNAGTKGDVSDRILTGANRGSRANKDVYPSIRKWDVYTNS
jgi:ribosomal protein S8